LDHIVGSENTEENIGPDGFDDDLYQGRGMVIYTFYGKVLRKELSGLMGSAKTTQGDFSDYDVINVMAEFTTEGELVRVIENPHPSGKRPLHKLDWKRVKKRVWAEGIPEILEEHQGEFNRLLCSFIDNKLISGTTILGVVEEHLGKNEKMDMYPFKTIRLKKGQRLRDMLDSVTIPDPSNSFMTALGYIMNLIDQASGVPKIIEGQVDLRDKTAFESSQLENHALKRMGQVITNIDEAVVPAVEMLYWHFYFYDDPAHRVLGDFKVIATGFSTFHQKRIYTSYRERLLVIAFQDPDFELMLAKEQVYRLLVESMGLENKKLLKDKEKIQELMKQRGERQQQGLMDAKELDLSMNMKLKAFESSLKAELMGMEERFKSREAELDRDHDLKKLLIELESMKKVMSLAS